MIYVSDLYSLLLDSLRIDYRGLSLEVDEFNRLLRLVNQNIFDDYIDSFEEDINSSDDLSFLKVHDYQINLTPQVSRNLGYASMPSNYYRVIGKPWTLDLTDNATRRYIDLVSSLEDSSREDDYLTKASTIFPTARIGGVNATNNIQIKVRPYTITTIYLSYLKSVVTPFLDYYINNTTLVKTFLPATSVAQPLPVGCTSRLGTGGGAGVTITSYTVNVEWGEGDLGLILAKMIQKVGASLPDEGLVQTGLTDEIKIQGA